MRQAKHAPNESGYAYLFGEFSYNAHSLAPLDTVVEMHLVPGARERWAPHTATGHPVDVLMQHCTYYSIRIKENRSKIIGNTLFFKHTYLTMPTLTNADALLLATKDLQTALKGGAAQILKITETVKN